MVYDVFICHASEDKENFVRPLVVQLQQQHVAVWYDDFALQLGDSIRRAIDVGLAQSRFGVVVLSPAFFSKQWPQYELDGLAQREMRGNDRVILPVWYDVDHDDVFAYSAPLAGKKATRSSDGLERVAAQILGVVRPQGSPLIVARDVLLHWGGWSALWNTTWATSTTRQSGSNRSTIPSEQKCYPCARNELSPM